MTELVTYAKKYEASITSKAEADGCLEGETQTNIGCMELFNSNVSKALDDLKSEICAYMEIIPYVDILHEDDFEYNRFQAHLLDYQDILMQGEEEINKIALCMGVAFVESRLEIRLKQADGSTYNDKFNETKTYDFEFFGFLRKIEYGGSLNMVGEQLAQTLGSKLVSQTGPFIEIIRKQIEMRNLSNEDADVNAELEAIVQSICDGNEELINRTKSREYISDSSLMNVGSYLEAVENFVNHGILQLGKQIFAKLSNVNSVFCIYSEYFCNFFYNLTLIERIYRSFSFTFEFRKIHYQMETYNIDLE